MSGDFKDSREIKELFRTILGSDVTIKDNLKGTEETVFCIFIQKLDESRVKEEIIFDESGIDLKKITDPLWLVVENMMKMFQSTHLDMVLKLTLIQIFEIKKTLQNIVDKLLIGLM